MENIIVIDYDCELCVEMYDFGDIGYYLFDCCVIDVEGIVVYQCFVGEFEEDVFIGIGYRGF